MVTVFNYFRGSFSNQSFRCREGDDVLAGGGEWEVDETELGKDRHRGEGVSPNPL